MSRAAQVRFEVEQFEVVDGDRCEVRGRWFGVRGRRFLRPVLTFTTNGRSRRLHADLAGKPWAAEEGGPWRATFPGALGGTELVGVELSVAPDLTVALRSPRPSPDTDGVTPFPTSSEYAPAADWAARGPSAHAADASHGRTTPSPFERRARADVGERVRRELVDARTEQRRLQSQVDHLSLQKNETAQRVQELIGQAGEVERELDAVTRARRQLSGELERVTAERDEALFQLDLMTAKRDAARNDYTELVRKLKATNAAHQRTLADHGRAIADPDAVNAAPVAAIAESAELARPDDYPPSESANLRAIRDPATLARRTHGSGRGARSYGRSVRLSGPAVVLLVITLLVTLIVLRP